MLTNHHSVRARARTRLLPRLIRSMRMRFPTFDAQIHESIMRTEHYAGDYVRFVALALAAQRVLAEEIPGAIAEVGVYRGETSALLHRLAPKRTLYLFDTFEGFVDAHLPDDIRDTRFRDTSADAVRRRVGDSQNVILKPGYVPDSLQDVAGETFGFVLLDMDLYEPTVAGLEFFYPRLSPGGYLFVHDYNNVVHADSENGGWPCRRAFDEFLADKPENLIEIGDLWGSALIRRASY